MKKSFVFLLLVLAVIVLVSPGIVGRLAEQSMDKNLDWAAMETEELKITPLGFDRSWVSSEGQHRVEIKPGDLHDSLLPLAREGGLNDLPALIIDTHIDHGLVPVSSIGREKGSLAPGLGAAVSTLSLEFENGEAVRLPGTIYSTVSLAGNLESNLIVEPGSFEVDQETAHWGNVDVTVTTDPYASVFGFEGSIEELLFVSFSNEVGVTGISFSGRQEQTRFGFAVGDAELAIDRITHPSDWGLAESGPVRLTTFAKLDGSLVSARTTLDVGSVPGLYFGPLGLNLDISIDEASAEAVGRVTRAIETFESAGPGDHPLLAIDAELRELLSAGLGIRVDKLDILAPTGTISATLDAGLQPFDFDDYAWTSLFLALEAELELSLPVLFYDPLMEMDPQAAVPVALGYLRRNGDRYEMEAQLSDGLLTINGAPTPVPLQGGN